MAAGIHSTRVSQYPTTSQFVITNYKYSGFVVWGWYLPRTKRTVHGIREPREERRLLPGVLPERRLADMRSNMSN